MESTAAVSGVPELEMEDDPEEKDDKEEYYEEEEGSVYRESGDGHEEPPLDNIELEEQEPLDLEDKVKHLQKEFKDFPRYSIRKVLQRPDVLEDLKIARTCLKKMSGDKEEPIKEDPVWGAQEGLRAGDQVRGRGRGRVFRGRRGCWNKNNKQSGEEHEESNEVSRNFEGEGIRNAGFGVNSGRGRGSWRRENNEGDSDGRGFVSRDGERGNAGRGRGGFDTNTVQGGGGGGKRRRNRKRNRNRQNQNRDARTEDWQGSRENLDSIGSNQGVRVTSSGLGHQRGRVNRGRSNWNQRGGFNNTRSNTSGEWPPYQDNHDCDRNPQHGTRRHSYGDWGNQYHPSRDYGDFHGDPFPQSHLHNRGGASFNRGRGGVNVRGRSRHEGQVQEVDLRGMHAEGPQSGWCRSTDQVEPNELFVRGLSDKTTSDGLRNFIESMTQNEVLKVTMLDNGNAFVILDAISDFHQAQQKVQERGQLDGAPVVIERVPVSSCILVKGIPPKTTRDTIEFYFANPKVGGDVKGLEFVEGDGSAVVHFVDAGVVQKVLSQERSLNDAMLTLERYHPHLKAAGNKRQSDDGGERTASGNNQTEKPFLSNKDSSMQGIRIAVDADVMEFIRPSEHFRELNNLLREIGFGFQYKHGSPTVSITEEKQTGKDNQDKGIEIVTSFTKKFTKFEIDVDKDYWKAVTETLPGLREQLGKNSLLMKEIESCKKIKVTCLESDSQRFRNMLRDHILEIQKNELRKTYAKKTIPDIEEEKLVLLKKIGFVEKITAQFSDLDVQIDTESSTIYMEGPKQQFSEASIKVYQQVAKMTERNLSLTQNVIDMLGSDEGLNRVKAELAKRSIEAVFTIDESNSKAMVVGSSNAHAENAAELIRGLTKEIKIKMDKDNEGLLATDRWSSVCDDVENMFKVYVRRNQWNETWVTGFKEDVVKAQTRMKTFLDENSIKTEPFHCPSTGVRRYVMENRMDDLKKMETGLKEYSVEIKPGERDDEFVISGAREGITRAQEAFHLLTTSIAMKTVQAHQPGLRKYFTDGKGDRLVRSVEQDHHCTIIVDSTVPKGSPSGAAGTDVGEAYDSSPESDDSGNDAEPIPFTHRTPAASSSSSLSFGRINISWKQSNIVAEKVDVLVTATVGKLAKVFSDTAGPLLQQALGTSAKQGGVTVTQGYGLPCNHVLHTHCCSWDGVGGAAENKLRTIVQNCLQKADQLGANSIAFPVIGTGGLNFPNNIACKVMINEAISYSNANHNSSVVDIRFVVFSQDQNLIAAFQQEFAVVQGQYSQAQSTRTRKDVLTGALPSSSSSHLAASFGRVNVQVIPGNLTTEQTDAIVNINHPDMNMQSAGALSKAVSKAAGSGLQDECTSFGPQTGGSVVVTNGHNLKVGHVIHMLPGSSNKQHIQTCIENCLRTADGRGFKAISVPAFGTGSFGMSADDSAEVTFLALSNVCPSIQHIQQIRVVIFQAHMVQAFQQEQQKYEVNQGVYSNGSARPQSSIRKSLTPKPRTKGPRPSQMQGIANATTTVKLYVFGKNQSNTDAAEKSLLKGFSEACMTQKVDNEAVSNLSDSQRRKLTNKAMKRDVSIKFEGAVNRVVVRGGPAEVTELVNDIWKEIQERNEKDKDREQAKVLYKTIRWQHDLHGTFTLFDKMSNAVIEKAHSSDDPRVTVTLVDEQYVIVLGANIGTGSTTGQQIKVKRHTVGMRTEGIELPKDWVPMPAEHGGKEKTVHLEPLSSGSPEYQRVYNMFTSTGGLGNIIKIERVQNPLLYKSYMVKKQKMDKDNGGANNERELFHGTDVKNVTAINTNGFNRGFCGAHGTAFGNGVYFARDASYSMRYASSLGHGHRSMYVALVLVGQYTAGRPGLITPPSKDLTRPEILYDSVDNGSGIIFVVFYDSQCYPEYLITFQ